LEEQFEEQKDEYRHKVEEMEKKIDDMAQRNEEMDKIQLELGFKEMYANFEKEKLIKDQEFEKQRKEIMNSDFLRKWKEDERKYLEGK